LGATAQGRIATGAPANIVVFDPGTEWSVDPMRFKSKGRNTPFAGRTVTGKVVHTFFEGRPSVLDSELAKEVLV
ncbi:MAG: hypothetical protein M3345_05735, partial [Actinomycetota bacterium]|nr:hypothetical protein [Actinomycetota bacterium]